MLAHASNYAGYFFREKPKLQANLRSNNRGTIMPFDA